MLAILLAVVSENPGEFILGGIACAQWYRMEKRLAILKAQVGVLLDFIKVK
jgi:hypothetical protein